MVAIAEVKTVLPQADPHWHPESDHGHDHAHSDSKEAQAHG
jgi:hypothetical protein